VPSSCPGRYGYPLWTAVVMVPIGALPIELAASAWMAISLGAALAAVGYILLKPGGPNYTIHARFQNASQLVKGDFVQVAGAPIGNITKAVQSG